MTIADYESRLDAAQGVIKEFGQVLASNKEMGWGIPESLLPRPKDTIKDAIQLLVLELGDGEPNLTKSLIEAYIILGQFIPDEDADVLAKGRLAMESNNPEHENWKFANAASKIVNDIKADMELLMEEIQLFMKHQQKEKPNSD